jgi:ribosomal protein S18 acetylase RimI-like enzyme
VRGVIGAEIREHTGPRDELRELFALAEDSPERLAASLGRGRVLVAVDGGRVIGHVQLVDAPGGVELLTMAVAEDRQGEGVGRALVEHAIAACRADGVETLRVATAAASTGNLRFYQRLGFRLLSVERDAFTAADGYPPGIEIEGIPLRDRVWLTRTP